MTAADIKEIRKYRQLTQAELARLLCVHEQTVSQWERGMQQPARLQRCFLAILALHKGARGEKLRDLLQRYDPAQIFSSKLLLK
jgi:DNA-binding transcriptional regulator YiaG